MPHVAIETEVSNNLRTFAFLSGTVRNNDDDDDDGSSSCKTLRTRAILLLFLMVAKTPLPVAIAQSVDHCDNVEAI